MRRTKTKKITTDRGKGDLEKTSKKNPPKKAASKPSKLVDGVKKFIKTTEIKIRFRNWPGILKCAKKLI